MASFKIIIIGSGLAGSLLANGLIDKGVEVAVYERLPENSKREGYQIRLGAPAVEGFRACLKIDHVAALVSKFGRANGMKSAAPVVYDRHFRSLLDLTRLPSYSKSASINRVVLRDALAGPVADAGKLHYGMAFERYEIPDPGTDRERVRVWFTDGTSDECAVLIGADGSHSKINQQVGLNNIQTLTSHMNAVAKVELKTKDFLTLNPVLTKYPVITFDSNKTLFFAAYLPDRLDLTSNKHQKEFDDELSSCFLGVATPTEMCPPQFEDLPQEQKWDYISMALRDWGSEYHEILQLLRSADLHVYKPRASVRPSKQWRKKAQSGGRVEAGHPRVWLMGDAIHAMLPNRGMGGNQSMRDTVKLLPLLVKLACAARCGHNPSKEEIATSCQEYEDEMIPRAFAWVQKSGGTNVMPVDANTWLGRTMFFLLAQVVTFASLWARLTGLFTTNRTEDTVPELQT